MKFVDPADILLDKLRLCNNCFEAKFNLEQITLAIDYIEEYHKNQKRHSNEPYYFHPIEVVNIVIKYRPTTEAVIISLLHDIVEDTIVSLNQIKFVFGHDIAQAVNQLTKLDSNNLKKLKLSNEENYYKLNTIFTADSKLVLLVKLADRIHNLSTISYIKSKDKRNRIALETLSTYLPLAKYVGIINIEEQLKKLAMNILAIKNS